MGTWCVLGTPETQVCARRQWRPSVRLEQPRGLNHITSCNTQRCPAVRFIPPGFAHGFCVTSEEADFVYRCGSYYEPELERGIAWDSAGIDWPTDQPVLSDRDQQNPTLADYSGPWFP